VIFNIEKAPNQRLFAIYIFLRFLFNEVGTVIFNIKSQVVKYIFKRKKIIRYKLTLRQNVTLMD
jgi:hypothetical protein